VDARHEAFEIGTAIPKNDRFQLGKLHGLQVCWFAPASAGSERTKIIIRWPWIVKLEGQVFEWRHEREA
jgi:hypothetical protein